VLKGVLYVGFGRIFDESKLVAIPRGAVCVIPANVPHHIAAKDRDVIYQEAGVGVTGTMFLSEASPRLVHLTASPLSSGRKTWRLAQAL
jgi:hypothetical protein